MRFRQLREIGCVGLAAALAALSGCAQIPPQQQTLLLNGQRAFERREYVLADEQLTRFLREAQGRPEMADALYIRGMSRAKLDRRAEAYNDLREAIARTGDAEVRWRANLMLGTMYFEDGNWAAAAQAFAFAVPKMSAAPPKDAILYKQGLSYERIGRWTEARACFQALTGQFPGSEFAAPARRRLSLGANAYAIQCGVFGKPENANVLMRDLKQQGFSAYTRSESRAAGSVQVVFAGPYATYEQAQQQLAAVRRRVPDAVLWP